MDQPARRRIAISVAPLIVTLVAARRAAPHVLAVDFVLLFASGVVFGVTLMGIIQMWRSQAP
jgi:hypothetical protein